MWLKKHCDVFSLVLACSGGKNKQSFQVSAFENEPLKKYFSAVFHFPIQLYLAMLKKIMKLLGALETIEVIIMVLLALYVAYGLWTYFSPRPDQGPTNSSIKSEQKY